MSVVVFRVVVSLSDAAAAGALLAVGGIVLHGQWTELECSRFLV